MEISFVLNGRPQSLEVRGDERVVELLRERLGLRGVKAGCGEGECGACTILVDGQPRLSCLMLAVQLEGREVVTIEGIPQLPEGRAVQEAFVAHGAVQCGFCTPGMVISATALLMRQPRPTHQQVREALAGNMCRCTGYQKIVEAVLAAARAVEARGG